MLNFEISERKDIWTDELKRAGHWVVANVDTSISWPTKVQKIAYDGIFFWIIPITRDAYPGVAARADGIASDELQKRILRFLSVISWIDGHGVILSSFSGGSLPHSMGRNKEGGYMIRQEFDFPYLPVVECERAKLALALMREGRGLNHSAFSFLTFFRVLEVAIGDGKKRKAWMPDAIKRLDSHQSKTALDELSEKGIEDVAKHLFESGRCAIAHAGADPIIDPDDPADSRRLYRELPIIEGLAEMAIEEEFTIKTTSTIYREHLYELAGFKRAFGEEIVDQISRGEPVSGEGEIDLPKISVRLRAKAPFPPFENLSPLHVEQLGSGVLLKYGREDGSLEIKFYLNFADERLEFDIYDGVFGTPDDESSTYAETEAHMIEFMKWYFLNGCLEIVDFETGEEVSRKDAFIPVNVIVEQEGFDKDIEFWRGIAEKRRELEIQE